MKKNNTKNEKSKKAKGGRSTKIKQDITTLEILDNGFDDKIILEATYSSVFDINEEIFKRLTYFLHHKGNSFHGLGKAIGVSVNYFSNAKKNKSSIGSKIIAQILYYYQDLSADWLILGIGEMTRSDGTHREYQKNKKINQEFEKQSSIIEELKKQIGILHRQNLAIKRLSEEQAETPKGCLFEQATQRFIEELNQEAAEEQADIIEANKAAEIDDSGISINEYDKAINEVFNPTTLENSKKAIETLQQMEGTGSFEYLYNCHEDFKKNYELLKKILQ